MKITILSQINDYVDVEVTISFYCAENPLCKVEDTHILETVKELTRTMSWLEKGDI